MNTIVGVYEQTDAQQALKLLDTYGINHDQISMVARDLDMVKSQVPTFAFTAPEFGQVIATGTLGNQLFTTLETGVTSSLLEALINAGISETDAEILVEAVKRGDILVSVESD